MALRARKRGFFSWLFSADANHDGQLQWYELLALVVARSLLICSIAFASWGWGTEIIGRVVVDAVGWMGWFVGLPIGGVVGFAASFFTAFWIAFAAKAFEQEKWITGVGISAGGIVAMIAVFLGMFILFAGFFDSSWEKLRLAQKADDDIIASVAAGRDPTTIDTELASAREDAARIATERTTYLGWQTTAMACPETGVCEAVKPIQRTLGVRADGIVRSAGDACATCGETMTAIAAKIAAADAQLADATERRDALSHERECIRRYAAGQVGDDCANSASGSAADDLAGATHVAQLRTTVKLFIATARATAQLRGWVSGMPSPLLEPTPEGRDLLQQRALNIGTAVALGGALLLDIFSMLANGVLALLSGAPTRRADGDFRPAAALGYDPSPGPRSGETQIDLGDGREGYVAPRAPRQPGETGAEYHVRHDPYLSRLREQLRTRPDDGYATTLAKRIADLEERRQRADDEALLIEQEELARAAEERLHRVRARSRNVPRETSASRPTNDLDHFSERLRGLSDPPRPEASHPELEPEVAASRRAAGVDVFTLSADELARMWADLVARFNRLDGDLRLARNVGDDAQVERITKALGVLHADMQAVEAARARLERAG